jgi:hypothetical protein
LRLLDPGASNDVFLAMVALDLTAIAVGYLRIRARLRHGRPVPQSDASTIFAPPGRTERWLGLATSISTGILIEVLYRGFLAALLASAGLPGLAILVLVAVAEVVPRGRGEAWRHRAVRALWATLQISLLVGTGSLLLPIAVRFALSVSSALLLWQLQPRAASQPEREPAIA